MKGIYRLVLLLTLLFGGGAFLLAFLMQGNTVAIFDPRGLIALQERNLIITAVLLMLIVVIPVFALTFIIAWRYRASNTDATYTPDHDHDLRAELVWWTIPCIIILILATITWKSTHELDPFRPLASHTKPITIQVVALDWKWLFIYPEQNIATVNFVQFPANTPVDFQITADAPMNSFWIPQLGGQIYAMAGMVTQLHLIADEVGSYSGASANFSGPGFSGMRFTAQSISQDDFDAWVQSVKQVPSTLSLDEYNTLSAPSEDTPIKYYSSTDKSLYNAIVMKFMAPPRNVAMPGMTH